MNVLYVLHSFPPFHWRGTEVYAMELSSAMIEQGHQAHVFHLRHDPGAERATMEHDHFRDIPVHRVRVRIDPSDQEGYFFSLDQDRLFVDLLNKTGPEVVHFLYYTGGLSLNLHKIAAERGARLFITVTDFSGMCPRGQMLDNEGVRCPGPREGLRCIPCLFDMTVFAKAPRLDKVLREYAPLWLLPARPGRELMLVKRRLSAVRDAFASASRVVYPNENTRKLYHYADIRGHEETVMDYGIDTQPFSHHQKRGSRTPRIGFIGQVLPHKGLHLLAAALRQIPLKYKLVIYGSTDDPGAREYLDSIELEGDKVELKGTFPFENMNKVLEGIDILCVPSNWDENCPLIVKYGIATGTTLVLADLPGMVAAREGIDRVQFFKPGDTRDLRRALIRAVADVKERGGQTGPPGSALQRALEAGAIKDVRGQAAELAAMYREES